MLLYNLIELILLSIASIYCSIKLTKYADNLAKSSHLNHGFIGIVLLGLLTSLPELFTSSVSGYIGAVNLGIGNIFGSNITNLFFLCIIDLYAAHLLTKQSIKLTQTIRSENITTSYLVIMITNIIILFMILDVLSDHAYILFALIFSIYSVGLYLIYHQSGQDQADDLSKKDEMQTTMKQSQAIRGLIIYGLLIFISSILLTQSAERISSVSIAGKTLGETFIGNFLLSFVTSLPELIVSLQSIRLGVIEMGLGNILGSCLFNLTIIPFSGLTYWLGYQVNQHSHQESFVRLIDSNQIIVALTSVILLSTILIFKTNIKGPSLYQQTFISMLISIVYVMVFSLLFLLR